jgi:hypothetical protein
MPLLETRGSGSALAYGLNSYNAFPMPIASGLQFYLDAYSTDSLSQNVHPNPTDLYGWYNNTAGNNSTYSRDTISSPVGSTPIKMVVTGADPYMNTYSLPQWNLHSALSGETWVLSVYVKADAATTCELFILGGNSDGSYNGDGIANAFAVDTNWQRVSVSVTLSNVNTRYVQIRLDGPNSGGTGRTLWFDGVQLERGSTPTTFNPKNGSTWYDLSGNNRNATRFNFPTINNFNSSSRSLGFDGSDDRCIGTTSNITGNSSRTMSVWFKGSGSDLIPFSLGNTAGAPNEVLAIVPQTNSTINVYGYTGTFDESGLSAGKNILDNNWHNLVLTWNALNPGTLGLWTDGVNSGNLARSAGEAYNTSNGYIVGTWAAVLGNRTWNGNIAQVYGYNRVLSQAEIQYNFNIAKTRFGL